MGLTRLAIARPLALLMSIQGIARALLTTAGADS